jgi:diguanylate cyclase (GGDEF)-like protein
MAASLPRALHVPLVPLAAAILAATMWGASSVQRDTASAAAERIGVAESMLTAMLDQETGIRGFLLTGDTDFLEPYAAGNEHYVQADEKLARLLAGDATSLAILRRESRLADRWRADSRTVLTARVPRPRRFDIGPADRRKALMDAFRDAHGRLVARLKTRRDAAQASAARLTAGLSALVLLVLGGLGTAFTRRRHRAEQEREDAERAYVATQAEFAEVMSVVSSEQEANELLRRHLVRFDPERQVTVLNRNNADNRLQAVTPVAGDDELAVRLADAEPRSCMAVRIGRGHEEDGRDDALVQCGLCGRQGPAMCQPLQASGRVIGSVLVRQEQPFTERSRHRLRESVNQAAPVLGNLRAIAMAEERAATDSLTGLPNRRAIDETVRRMAAQANRTGRPLAALAIDLDHFKAINDQFGHEMGDEVLAAVGTVVAATMRVSDFAGRLGGEEFLVLAADTSSDGGLVLAEKLRTAIAGLEIRDLDLPVTASIGVAELPSDAADPTELMRRADRALYAAKNRGRNRVETAAGSATPA